MPSQALRDVTVPDDRTAAEAEIAFRTLAEYLLRHPTPTPQLTLVSEDSEPAQVVVPSEVLRLFIEILDNLARGHAITVAPIHAELTTQQAADLLNVSRPYVVRLLERGEIPYHRVGNRRRIRLEDVLAYQHADDEQRRENLRALIRETDELGLYDDVS
jgi:excisionase family DNA binding protein